MFASYMHWLIRCDIFWWRTNQPTNKQGDSRSRIYVCAQNLHWFNYSFITFLYSTVWCFLPPYTYFTTDSATSAYDVLFLNCLWLTARLKMRMLVVFLIVLFSRTTRTTRRLPTKPITMTKVNRMGTMMGTIVIRVFSCSKSTSSSPSSTIIVLFIWWTTYSKLPQIFYLWNFSAILATPQSWIPPNRDQMFQEFPAKVSSKVGLFR